MQTAPHQNQNFSLAGRESERYDRKNAILCLWISYAHSWVDNYNFKRSNQMYYLKYNNEKNYNDLNTELPRVFEILKRNYMEGRAFKTLCLYQNWNLGGTHPDKTIENPVVFKIVNRNNALCLEIQAIDGDTNGSVRAYIEKEFQGLIEIHNSVG